jgi:hypothetical protein
MTSEQNPGGQKRLTREAYDLLSPRGQGYASYMQAAWNDQVPEECPHPQGSDAEKQWQAGQHAAYIAVLDSIE